MTWVMLMHGKNHVRSLVRLRLTRVVDLLKIRSRKAGIKKLAMQCKLMHDDV